jgi:hypothetical protein
MDNIVNKYLDLLDSQREAAFTALDGLTEAQVWERPAPKEWCLGEILDHNTLLIASVLPLVRAAWKTQQRRAEKHRHRPYATEIEDPYRKRSFPMWVGFLWTPRYTPKRPVPLSRLMAESRELHAEVRRFYADKDPDLLGNVSVYDPLIGRFNLIGTLRIGIYHDQLHFDDVFQLARAVRRG